MSKVSASSRVPHKRRLILPFFIVLSIILSILFWGLQIDDELSPGASSLIELSTPKDQSQAYLYLMGIFAAKQDDPLQVGQERLTAIRQVEKLSQMDDSKAQLQDYPKQLTLTLPKSNEFCLSWKENCLDSLFRETLNIDAILDKNQLLLNRYKQFIKMNDYATLSIPMLSEPLAPYEYLTIGHRLIILSSINKLKLKQSKEAIEDLYEHLKNLRRHLIQQDTLVGKMLFVMHISETLDISSILSRKINQKIFVAIPELSREEKDFTKPMSREFRMIYELYKVLHGNPEFYEKDGDLPSWYVKLIFKTNMSSNTDYKKVATIIKNSRLSPIEFTQIIKNNKDKLAVENSFNIRNVAGNILNQISRPNNNEYISRLLDLEIKIKLFNSTINNEKITTEFISIKNSYYQKKVIASWSKDKNSLCFNGPLPDIRKIRCLKINAEPEKTPKRYLANDHFNALLKVLKKAEKNSTKLQKRSEYYVHVGELLEQLQDKFSDTQLIQDINQQKQLLGAISESYYKEKILVKAKACFKQEKPFEYFSELLMNTMIDAKKKNERKGYYNFAIDDYLKNSVQHSKNGRDDLADKLFSRVKALEPKVDRKKERLEMHIAIAQHLIFKNKPDEAQLELIKAEKYIQADNYYSIIQLIDTWSEINTKQGLRLVKPLIKSIRDEDVPYWRIEMLLMTNKKLKSKMLNKYLKNEKSADYNAFYLEELITRQQFKKAFSYMKKNNDEDWFKYINYPYLIIEQIKKGKYKDANITLNYLENDIKDTSNLRPDIEALLSQIYHMLGNEKKSNEYFTSSYNKLKHDLYGNNLVEDYEQLVINAYYEAGYQAEVIDILKKMYFPSNAVRRIGGLINENQLTLKQSIALIKIYLKRSIEGINDSRHAASDNFLDGFSLLRPEVLADKEILFLIKEINCVGIHNDNRL